MMVVNKILKIFFVLFLAQVISAKPLDDKDQQFLEENFIQLPKQHAARIADLSRQLLKNEYLQQNKPDIIEFKKKFTTLVEKFDANPDDLTTVYGTIDEFGKIANYYSRLAPEKVTDDIKGVREILGIALREAFGGRF